MSNKGKCIGKCVWSNYNEKIKEYECLESSKKGIINIDSEVCDKLLICDKLLEKKEFREIIKCQICRSLLLEVFSFHIRHTQKDKAIKKVKDAFDWVAKREEKRTEDLKKKIQQL